MHNYDELVSVVIPCYNHEAYIASTIDSVLSQTYQNIELIVGDDCSTDDTRSILRQIKDPRVKCVFYPENKGVISSLNGLLRQARGEYICMLGSDDFFYPEKLERQLEAFRNNPSLGAVFTGVQTVDEDNVPYDEHAVISVLFQEKNRTQAQWIRHFFETGNHLCHSSVMIPGRVREEIGWFQYAYRQLHDFDYWLRLLCRYPIELIPEKLTAYRRAREDNTSVSATGTANEMRVLNEYAMLFSQLFESIPQPLFEEAFSDLIQNPIPLNDALFEAERFRILQTLSFADVDIHGSAVLFFLNNILPHMNEDVDSTFARELIQQFYEQTGMQSVGENVREQNKQYMKAVHQLSGEAELLRREIEKMLNTKGWKMLETIRGIRRKIHLP